MEEKYYHTWHIEIIDTKNYLFRIPIPEKLSSEQHRAFEYIVKNQFEDKPENDDVQLILPDFLVAILEFLKDSNEINQSSLITRSIILHMIHPELDGCLFHAIVDEDDFDISVYKKGSPPPSFNLAATPPSSKRDKILGIKTQRNQTIQIKQLDYDIDYDSEIKITES